MATQKSFIKFSPIFLTFLLTGFSLGGIFQTSLAKPPDHAPAWGYRCRQGNERACDRLNRDRDREDYDDDYENYEERDDYDDNPDYRVGRLESGRFLDTEYRGRRSVIFRQDERYELTLYLDENLSGSSNQILIRDGAKIRGEFRPAGEGVRFFARYIELRNGRRYSLNATSQVIYGNRDLRRDPSDADIITEAAKVLVEEILGNDREEYRSRLIALDPGSNLELRLNRDLRFDY